MGELVDQLGKVAGNILSSESVIESGGKVRATIEELQALSRYELRAEQQLEKVSIRYFSDVSFFSQR